ncbi:chaperone protein TorD [compost metagenome]
MFNKISGERDDHIALELEFMAVLSEEMLSKAGLHESCLELADVQIRFLENHLMQWAPRFSNELAAATSSPIYIGLAELLVQFLDMDLEKLYAWRKLQN